MIGRFLDQISEVLSRRRFDVWEVFLLDKRSELVQVGGAGASRAHSALDHGCGMRGLLEGRAGYASTTRLDAGGLSKCADALAASALCGSPGATLPLPGPDAPSEPFEAYDPAIEGLTRERMASLLEEAESGASVEKSGGARPGECQCRMDRGQIGLRNSFGLDVRFRFSRVTLRLAGEAGCERSDALLSLWDFGYGPSAIDAGVLGREFSRLMAAKASAVSATEGRTPLVLSPKATAQLTGLCALPAKKEGALSGSAAFTLLDDGRLPGGYGSTPFDGEGTPTRRLLLVEKGIPKACPHTEATASLAKSTSTGNALRPDFAFAPTLGYHNLHLAPTPADPRDSLKNLNKGIYLEEICELPSRGEAPGTVALEGWGFRLVRGELTESVRGVRVRTRLEDLLLRLVEVGPDLATFPGGIGGATCLLEDVPLEA